jgi:hypothetical protein
VKPNPKRASPRPLFRQELEQAVDSTAEDIFRLMVHRTIEK